MDQHTDAENPEEHVIDLRVLFSDMWRGFIKFWWLMALLVLLFGGFQFYRSYVRYTPQYQVSATFTVQMVRSNPDSADSYSFYYNKSTADQLGKVFPYVVGSSILEEKVCSDLGLSYMPASVSASVLPGTNMMTLTTRGTDPQQTYDVLMSVVDNYDSVADYIIGRTKLVMITPPQVPEAPYNSLAWRHSVMKGVLLGALLGLAWIVLYALMRRTVRTKENIHNQLRQHCLGILPHVTFKQHRKAINRAILPNNPMIGREFLESLRLLRTSIQNSMGRDKKVLMVTSTAPAEGKSVTSVNLAASFAESGKKVLLIDCDLRNSGIQQMTKDSKLEKVSESAENYVISHTDSLGFDLLTFTDVKAHAGRILRKSYLKTLLDTVRDQYDLILVDTPPCGMISDAVVVSGVADAVLYVVRQDTVMVSSICSGINTLKSNDAQILGCILTGATGGLGGYGSKYSYGGYYKSYYYGKYHKNGYGGY